MWRENVNVSKTSKKNNVALISQNVFADVLVEMCNFNFRFKCWHCDNSASKAKVRAFRG